MTGSTPGGEAPSDAVRRSSTIGLGEVTKISSSSTVSAGAGPAQKTLASAAP
jgi:hypothetical protein